VRTHLALRPKVGPVVAGLALIVSLVACGTSTVHRTMAATYVDNGAGFYPATITVDKKDEVIITVGNGTDKTHGFSIEGYPIHKTVDPNQTIRVKFKAKRAGTFKIYCQLHPTHKTAVLQVQ
jgi:nitrosocyanin